MEPTNLNPSSHEDDPLAALLRQPAPALLDDGFSTRVLAALPPPAPAPQAGGLKLVLCVAGAVAGLVFAVNNGVSWAGLHTDAEGVEPVLIRLSDFLSDPWFIPALIIAGWSVFFALRTGDAGERI